MISKIVSFIIASVLITSIFVIIPSNVGKSGWSVGQSVELEVFNPQNEGGLSSSGACGLADSPWPMFRQNLNHTGVSPYDTSENNGQLKWSFTAGHWVWSSPAIGSDGTIYVGSDDYNLYAIKSDGHKKWNFKTKGYIESSPAICSDGTIYVGSYDNKLYAINPNGTEKWNFTTNDYVFSSPVIGSDGTIYIGSKDTKLYAINSDGTEKWNFTTNDYIFSSPAIGPDGTIYIGSCDKKLYAIDPNGTKKWSYLTGDKIHWSSPSIGKDGTIYIGSYDNNLYAINPNGTKKWNFITNGWIDSTPVINLNGTIYIGSSDSNLYAINADGIEMWRFTTGSSIVSSPSIGSDGTIYVGSWDYKIYAIEPNGLEKWNHSTSYSVKSSVAIGSDGTIYVGTGYKNLYAIGIPNIPPIAIAGSDQTKNEGGDVQFDGSNSYDTDGTIESHEWDFDSSDGLWWETGAPPDAIDTTPTHIYGDDGVFIATLRVTDNDNLSTTDTCNITVLNIYPTVEIESAVMQVEIGLRVTGRKYNNVSMILYGEGYSIGYVSVERIPGSPNEQMAWIPISLDLTKTYSATVTFTPEDPPNIGANPVWIYIKSSNGTINTIHHTFNVQQSKNRDSDHWNHIEPWEVELNPYFIGLGFGITSHVTDPGSDDETLAYTYGLQIVTVTYLNNPPNPDPYPSPEVNPRDIIDTTTLVYEGPGTITLVVKDDDNMRLGIGQGSDSFDI